MGLLASLFLKAKPEPYTGQDVLFMDGQGVDHAAFITARGDFAAGENLAVVYDASRELVHVPLVPYSGKQNKGTWRFKGE